MEYFDVFPEGRTKDIDIDILCEECRIFECLD